MLPLVSIITPCYNAAPFISQAIESVLAQSFGDWEMIIVDDCSSLDSDDIWLPNKLSDQLKVFEKSEVAIVFSNYEKVSLGGERCGREVIAPCEVDYRLLLKGNCIGCLTAMYDSALTGKIFFKEIGHEDYVCWLSILKQGYKAQNTNTVTALYRVGDHSVSSNKLKAMRWQWNILRNEMDLPVYKAVYYFIHYAIRAFAKAMR